MATTIDIENAKSIRTPMTIVGGISAATGDALTYTVGTPKVYDTIHYATMAYPMRVVTDLQGDGFPLDGTAQWYDASATADATTGKMGLRSNVGEGLTVTVKASVQLSALTIEVTGTGTVTCEGVTQDIAGVVIVEIPNKTSTTLTFDNASEIERIEVASIVAGISLPFSNDNIVRCDLALRSDLSPDNPSWKVSEIEYKVYYPYDIGNAVSSIGEDVPLYYQAGYPGDMSTLRKFYVDGTVTQKDGVITMKGVDASHKLMDNALPMEKSYATKDHVTRLYRTLSERLKKAGIEFKAETAPESTSTATGSRYIYIDEEPYHDFLDYIMNTWHDRSTTSSTAQSIGRKRFWPVFVDAGTPCLTWSYPASKWTVKEEDCADVEDAYHRNYNAVTYRVNQTNITAVDYPVEVQTVDVKAGSTYWVDYDSPYVDVHLTNCRKVLLSTLRTLKFIADKTGQSRITGRRITLNEDPEERTYSVARAGVPLSLSYEFNNKHIVNATVARDSILQRSNHTGSFTFKGDPRWQPRDVFTFERLDGTLQLCTVEEIKLTHEEGGTSADVTYREGVV